jgi:predicted nucleic acid-binding protein
VTGYLLDTNVVSELMRRVPQPNVVAWLDATSKSHLYLSVITLGELRRGAVRHRDSIRRARLQAWIDDELRPKFADRVLAVDEAVAERWGVISGEAMKIGRPLPTADGLLAATALHWDLTFVTRDGRGLDATGVALLDPWSL